MNSDISRRVVTAWPACRSSWVWRGHHDGRAWVRYPAGSGCDDGAVAVPAGGNFHADHAGNLAESTNAANPGRRIGRKARWRSSHREEVHAFAAHNSVGRAIATIVVIEARRSGGVTLSRLEPASGESADLISTVEPDRTVAWSPGEVQLPVASTQYP